MFRQRTCPIRSCTTRHEQGSGRRCKIGITQKPEAVTQLRGTDTADGHRVCQLRVRQQFSHAATHQVLT